MFNAFWHKSKNMTDEKNDNAKEVLLELAKKNNLKILKIDCCNYDGECCECYKREYHAECTEIHHCSPKYYTTLEQLDFFYNDNSCNQELYGTVYCIDKEDKQPVWLTRWCDDISSGWIVNRIPEFYKNKVK